MEEADPNVPEAATEETGPRAPEAATEEAGSNVPGEEGRAVETEETVTVGTGGEADSKPAGGSLWNLR